MRRLLIAGNWKSNCGRSEASDLIAAVNNGVHQLKPSVDVMIFPPFTALAECQVLCSEIEYGSQDCSRTDEGAYTGEVAASTLGSYGCSSVIIGHSERRQLFVENDEVLGDKLSMAFAAGLGVIFCVGETLEQREAGKALETCTEQLGVFVKSLQKAGNIPDISRVVVVAYEPVWAIGTGKSASPDEAQDIHASLRHFLKGELTGVAGCDGADIRLLYGGSVKPGNATEFFRQPDIDGALVGGASLDADKFIDILRMADALTGD